MDCSGRLCSSLCRTHPWSQSFRVPAPLPNGGIGKGWMATSRLTFQTSYRKFRWMTSAARLLQQFLVPRAFSTQSRRVIHSLRYRRNVSARDSKTMTLIKGYKTAGSLRHRGLTRIDVGNYMAAHLPIARTAVSSSHWKLLFPTQTGFANRRVQSLVC